MIRPSWIAADWGTTHLRVWAIGADDEILAEATSDKGMSRLAPGDFEPALLGLIGDWVGGPAEIIACGMVGSRQGWVEAPYRPVPCLPLGGRLATATAADPRLSVRVVPGLKQVSPPDVMRGEETQIAGFLAINPGFDGVICLPGTHSKWVRVSAGEVVSFASYLTGELHGLLAGSSVLRHSLGEGWDDAAFVDAVSETLSRPERLAGGLFGIRAAGLLGQVGGAAARARLSGLLIGAELAAARPYWLGQQIAIVAAEELAGHYGVALSAQGAAPIRAAAREMTIAGLAAARALSREEPAR